MPLNGLPHLHNDVQSSTFEGPNIGRPVSRRPTNRPSEFGIGVGHVVGGMVAVRIALDLRWRILACRGPWKQKQDIESVVYVPY